ncbi:MAG TPA: type II toxin-antitoxin system RelE/ParE family toxin [Candidatus Thermoplasmatota archaeon]|nr:type II toxin-antitoxin system RelE/ParE family toxin [Candidatus Thermoplasmatota archaeon]
MGLYRIAFQHKGEREFGDLPPDVRRRFSAAFEELAENPFRARPKCDVRRLKGERGAFAVRVGDYRGTFVVVGDTVWFLTFAHRSVAYRG